MSGYTYCACPDCFEIAVGDDLAMCLDCEEAGCDGEGECQAPGAELEFLDCMYPAEGAACREVLS